MGIQINGQTGRITRPDGNVKIPNSEIGITQLTVANGASVTGIMTVTAGVGKTITLDPSQKMLTLGDTTMHQDSGTGDTILMRNGAYNPFRASRFLIDDVTVIDANRNFIGATGTFTGNVSVGGVLTYEDVTNVDSVGIITARSGIHVTGTGVNGRIGIGTDNPTSDLQVVSYGDHGKIRVESSGDGNRAGIEFFRESSAGTGKGAAGIWVESETGNTSGELRFGVAYNKSLQSFATKMILDVNGKLGIGADNPASELDITSSVEDGTGSLANHGIRLAHVGATNEEVIPISACFVSTQNRSRAGIGFISKQADSTDGYAGEIGFYTRSAADGSGLLRSDERLRITSAGDVGIGDNNPTTKLTVKAGNGNQLRLDNAGERYTQISIRNNGTQKAALWLDETDDMFDVYAYTGYGIRFLTNATETVRITSDGKLGINANNPGGQLSVSDASTYTVNVGPNGSAGALVSTLGGSASLALGTDSTERLRIDSSGHVGIDQTNPNNMLDIGGVGTNGLSVRMGGSGYSTLFRYGSNEDNYIAQGPSGQTIFRDRENDEHVRIDSAGRMGLNCPGQDLSAFNANGSQDLVIFSRGSSGLSAHAGITLHGGSTTSSQCSLTFADGNAGAQRYAGSIDYLHSVDALSFRVATTGAMRIDSAHRLMMGTTTSVHTYRKIQVVGSYSGTAQRQGALLRYGEASSNGPVLTFEKNRSNSGGTSSVASDDALGEVQFQGTDQAGSYRLSSMIRGEAATTPASNRVPGQIKFYCDDGSSLNETVRITRYGRTQVSKEFAIRNSAGYGNARNSRVEYIQGGNGTYSTCTVTIDQNSYGSTVYDIKVHGYSSSTAHVAGGYYQNGSIYNDSKSINHATSGVSVSGPTAAGGQTATFVFSRTNGWVHPICSISISTGGDGFIDESDITIVWS